MEEIKMTYDKITIELTNYKKEFWNLMMKGTKGNYENLKGGKISDEQFIKMTSAYENEQQTLNVRITELNKIIKNEQEKITNTSSFLNLIKCYTNITKLDAEIIRTFIEKVYIYNADTIGTKKIKKIKIVFNFIGEIDLPTKNK